MARIRTIKPELHSSPSLSRCSIGARYLFVGLFTLADDAGRTRDLPKQILGNLFPLDEDVTVEMVVGWLDELEKVDCIRRYSTDDSNFIYLPNWRSHQVISKPTPSRIPDPPEDSQGNPGNPAEVIEMPAESQMEVEVGNGSLKFEKEIGNTNSSTRARDTYKPFPQSLLALRHEDHAVDEALRLYPDDPDRQRAAVDAWHSVNDSMVAS
jgi:hypothetical protein